MIGQDHFAVPFEVIDFRFAFCSPWVSIPVRGVHEIYTCIYNVKVCLGLQGMAVRECVSDQLRIHSEIYLL